MKSDGCFYIMVLRVFYYETYLLPKFLKDFHMYPLRLCMQSEGPWV